MKHQFHPGGILTSFDARQAVTYLGTQSTDLNQVPDNFHNVFVALHYLVATVESLSLRLSHLEANPLFHDPELVTAMAVARRMEPEQT